MKKIFKFFSLLGLGVASVIFVFVFLGEKNFPDSIQLLENEELHGSGIYSLSNAQEAVQSANSKVLPSVVQDESYTVNISVLNTIPVKSSTVTVSKRRYAVPSGDIFGVKIFTDGVLIVGMDDVFTDNGAVNPAKEAGLKVGDIILSVNEVPISKTTQLTEALQNAEDTATVCVRRDGKEITAQLKLAYSQNEHIKKVGLWVRDSTAGVGTMTFYDPDTGVFGGLGHAICDVDTGEIMPFQSGIAVKTEVNGCYKGSPGITGELCGVFQDQNIGTLYNNKQTGVYGILEGFDKAAVPLPVATKKEVKTGYAQIISTVDETGPHYYDVQIKKIYPNSDENGKNMIIEVTDDALIAKTGGIIQGMSGSPIVQNGMLVGAVTHVFVNNALQGYGIFAETMLDNANEVESALLQKVS